MPPTSASRSMIGGLGKPGHIVGKLLQAWSELEGMGIVDQAVKRAG